MNAQKRVNKKRIKYAQCAKWDCELPAQKNQKYCCYEHAPFASLTNVDPIKIVLKKSKTLAKVKKS